MSHGRSIRRDLKRKIKKNKCSYYTLYCKKKNAFERKLEKILDKVNPL